MLDTLRNAAGTWVAKILLLLLVMSFAVWGISGSIMGGTAGASVVTAGETTVSLYKIHTAKLVLTDALIAATKPLDTSGAEEILETEEE